MKKVMLKTSLSLAVALASSHFSPAALRSTNKASAEWVQVSRAFFFCRRCQHCVWQPAGMARLKREQITVGGAAIFAKTDISGQWQQPRGNQR
jgi:long-chain fatty acid transport protein